MERQGRLVQWLERERWRGFLGWWWKAGLRLVRGPRWGC